MRNIINISLPPDTAKQVQRAVKRGNFASTSEFMRYLIRLWNTHKLGEELSEERRKFSDGKYKVLKSLKSLRK